MPTFKHVKFKQPQVLLRPKPKQPTTPVQRANNIQFQSWDPAPAPLPELPVVVGVPNPYGVGASAYEPQTELFDPGSDEPLLKGYDDAYNAVQRSRSKEAAQAADGLSVQGQSAGSGAPLITVDGQVGEVLRHAQSLLGKPYIWGGTTSRGVDCSGLLYYAFNAAGIKMPRYRAVDYGRMGQQLAPEEARAGDIVYWDNPGSTDHVGIYLGNGQVLQAPQSGDVVKVSKVWGNPTYRRIVDDSAFGQMATPSGAPTTSYNGRPATVAEMAKSPVYISDKRRGRPF